MGRNTRHKSRGHNNQPRTRVVQQRRITAVVKKADIRSTSSLQWCDTRVTTLGGYAPILAVQQFRTCRTGKRCTVKRTRACKKARICCRGRTLP